MAEVSKLIMPNGATYDIKDATARQLIAGGITFVVSWDGVTAPVVANIPAGVKVKYNSTTYTGTMSPYDATPGAFYLVASDIGDSGPDYYDEYVSAQVDSSTKVWEKLGGKTLNLEGLEVTYTPKGSVSVTPDISQSGAITVSPAASGTATYTPEGSVTVTPTKNTAGALTVSPAASGNATYTPEGTIGLADSGATEDKTVVVSGGSGTTTYTPAGTVSQPTFSGDPGSVSVSASYTPAGDVTTATTANKTATVSPAASGDATYTPAGSLNITLSNPELTSTGSYTPAGSVSLTAPSEVSVVDTEIDERLAEPGEEATYTPTGSVGVTSAGSTSTAVTAVAEATPSGTQAAGEVLYTEYDAASETLTFKKLTRSTGTFKTGDAAYGFTGTGVMMSVPIPDITSSDNLPSAAFSGTAATITVKGTPNVSVATKTFSGTGVRLVTGNIPVPATYTFSGTAATISSTGSFTPSGTVSKPTFSGTGTRLTGTYTVPKAWKFTGTGKRLKVDGTDVVVGITSASFTGTGKRLKVDSEVVVGISGASFSGTQETVPVTSSDPNAGNN